MLGLRNLKGALPLLFLTVFITYSCLYTLTFVNKFQPKSFPPPLPAAATNSGTQVEVNNSAGGVIEPKETTENSGKHDYNGDTKNAVHLTLKDGVWKAESSNTASVPGLIAAKEDEDDNALATVKHGDTISENSDSQAEGSNTAGAQENGFNDGHVLETVAQKSSSEDSNASLFENTNEKDAFEIATFLHELKETTPIPLWPITLEPSNASALGLLDFDKYSPKDKLYLEDRLKVLEERATLVGKVCKEQPPHLHTPSGANHLVWDTEHDPSIVWCPNYKVASTTMMMNFLRVSPQKNKLQKSEQRVKQSDVRDIYWRPETGMEKAKILRDSIRVIMVRHPFTRILSAYRDKMTKKEPGPKKFEFRKLQRKIIAKYRSSKSSIDSPFPTFPEFVQYVIHETQGLSSTQDWKKKVRCWVTYWAHCNVCTTDYTVIMKLETMAEDKKFLVTLSNLEELKEESSKDWLHLRNVTSRDLAPEFYSQLTRDQILQLYGSYKLDFDLFDYHIDEYLALV